MQKMRIRENIFGEYGYKSSFYRGEHSTAIENVHYEFVDNPDKMFVIPAKKSYGTIKVDF
ncbi:MAG: hypothetical protein ACLU4J_15125 [Butyricimonas paravirosa]